MSWLTRLRARAAVRWAAVKRRYGWLRHLVAAWDLLQRNNGNQYAAAITYFSFLALFPLLLLAVAVIGFVLHSDPSAQQAFFRHLTDTVPGDLGRTLRSSLQAAIRSRTSLGVVGLLGVLLTGLGWIGNLRTAIDAVWGREAPKSNFLKVRLANLIVLVGLGIGTVVSLTLTIVGTALTDQILRAWGWDHLPGASALLKAVGIAVALLGDVIIFWWLMVRLPQQEVPLGIAVRGALLAATGFEVLKIAATYTIAHTANSPTAGPFAGTIAILIWIQLVARYLLFACAWTATLTAGHRAAAARPPALESPAPALEPPAPARDAAVPELSPAAVGVALVGTGALAGAAATWALTRPRPRPSGR